MIVVTNTSPLLNLAVIGEARLLPDLFGRVTAPNMVREEIDSLRLRDQRFRSADTADAADFATVRDSSRVALLSLHLDPGEAEAIALALELQADLILLDERRATRAARQLGLRTLGLLGVLLLAKRKGLIDQVRPLLDRLETEAGFWIAPDLRQQVCQAAKE
ncbi:MAG: hypothetical protein Fur0032_05600 [Terrimicrobiaceae bacterium]